MRPVWSRDRDEVVGRELALRGMVPADQGLDREDVPGEHVDLRLIDQHELTALDGAAQSLLQQEFAADLDVELGRIELVVVAPEFLCPVHGRVGVGEQRVGILAVVGVVRQPNAAADAQRLAADLQRRADRRPDLGDRGRDAVDVLLLIDEQNHELVAAEAHHGVHRAQARDHAASDILEQLVAGVVAERVVDDLEVVEIDEGDGHPVVGPLRVAQGLFEAVLEQRAVGQAGESVVVRHEANALLAELAFDGDAGDVAGRLADVQFLFGRDVRRLVVQGEDAERLLRGRDDGNRPARAVCVRGDQVTEVMQKWIVDHVGDHDGFAAMNGGAAGPDVGPMWTPSMALTNAAATCGAAPCRSSVPL